MRTTLPRVCWVYVLLILLLYKSYNYINKQKLFKNQVEGRGGFRDTPLYIILVEIEWLLIAAGII